MTVHQQEAFQPLLTGTAPLPVAEQLASEVFSLPLCPDMTDGEAHTVLGTLHSVRQTELAPVGQ